MKTRITVNIGFITNSSSVVHCFPKEILNDPDVQAFMSAYEIDNGFVGSDLWHRGECASLLISKENFDKAAERLTEVDYGTPPPIGNADEHVTIIYGDEYSTLFSKLCALMREVAERKGLSHGSYDYN